MLSMLASKVFTAEKVTLYYFQLYHLSPRSDAQTEVSLNIP